MACLTNSAAAASAQNEDALFDLARRLTGLDVASLETWSRVRFTVASLDF
jgi:hypothetical protein